VLVARALVRRPALLLLDEPFTGLDVPSQDLLAKLFRDLAEEGRALLMATHDIISARHDCDRIALLNRTIVAVGEPGKLAADPEPWMKAFDIGPDSTFMRVLEANADRGEK
jgi:manganese/iron transport system ATP-binding protein